MFQFTQGMNFAWQSLRLVFRQKKLLVAPVLVMWLALLFLGSLLLLLQFVGVSLDFMPLSPTFFNLSWASQLLGILFHILCTYVMWYFVVSLTAMIFQALQSGRVAILDGLQGASRAQASVLFYALFASVFSFAAALYPSLMIVNFLFYLFSAFAPMLIVREHTMPVEIVSESFSLFRRYFFEYFGIVVAIALFSIPVVVLSSVSTWIVLVLFSVVWAGSKYGVIALAGVFIAASFTIAVWLQILMSGLAAAVRIYCKARNIKIRG